MEAPLIKASNLVFKYRDSASNALNDLTFSVRNGEWLAIVGHNGSGKSTLARILNGMQLPDSGTVEVAGQLLSEDTVWEIRKDIGMVFQNPDNQFVGTTVRDDVAFGLENLGVDRETMVSRVDEAINLVRMDEFVNQEPHQLSGGQKQRVAIAGILAVRPKVILLDEATSMLDPKGREEVLETIRKLKEEQGITVISITHDLEEAAKADRIIVMNKGGIYAEGTPGEIFLLDRKLTEIGLDIPFPVKAGKLLKQAGVPLGDHYVSDEGLVNELWTLLSRV